MTTLSRVVSILGRASTDAVLVDVFASLGIAPSDDTVTTDENTLEFRFEDGVLVEVWVNPGTEWELPRGLRWDMSPDEIRSLLGPGEPLGIDKTNPGAFQWCIVEEGAARMFVHMNVDGGFALRGEVSS